MSAEIVGCSRSTPIASIAKTMATHQLHALFVLDNSDRPVGVVSDVDLLAGEWLGTDHCKFKTLQNTNAGDLMTAPAETICGDATLQEAVEKMRQLRVARLLVCDEESAVGVLSVSDLVAVLRRPPTGRACTGDVMSHAIVTCRPEAPMHSAVRAMIERRSRSVVITEGDRAVGVLTGGDVLALYATPSGAWGSGTVAEFMTSPPITATPDLSLSDAANRMLTHEIHRLVVVNSNDGSGPLGVISTADIVAEMADDGSAWQT